MINKLKHFSYHQLLLLKVFLANPGKTYTIKELTKLTQISGKSLGGVISSLSRSRFRGNSLIEPFGRATDGSGLRWKLNKLAIETEPAKKEVRRLLTTYA